MFLIQSHTVQNVSLTSISGSTTIGYGKLLENSLQATGGCRDNLLPDSLPQRIVRRQIYHTHTHENGTFLSMRTQTNTYKHWNHNQCIKAHKIFSSVSCGQVCACVFCKMRSQPEVQAIGQVHPCSSWNKSTQSSMHMYSYFFLEEPSSVSSVSRSHVGRTPLTFQWLRFMFYPLSAQAVIPTKTQLTSVADIKYS